MHPSNLGEVEISITYELSFFGNLFVKEF